MYANLDRKTVKELNRLDKRRRMKYAGRNKEGRNAEELRATRGQVEGPEGRYEGQLAWAPYRYTTNHR